MPNTDIEYNQRLRTDYVNLAGRRKIYSSCEEITADNVVQFVTDVLDTFMTNRMEMEYLYWYRRGIHPILWREKEVRPEINNKISVGLADYISVFKNGYFLTRPAFYVARKDGTDTSAINELNDYIYLSGKQKADNDVVNWFHTVGVGVMFIEANKDHSSKVDCPFKVYSLDPRSSCLVYSLAPDNHPIAGLHMVVVDQTKIIVTVYTSSFIYKLSGGYRSVSDTSPVLDVSIDGLIDKPIVNPLGLIPMVEYIMNENRMSCFESVVPLIDQVDNVMSNAADGLEQHVQSLCVATNCNFEEGTTANSIRESGLLALTSTDGANVDFKILNEELNQSQTQVMINNLLDRINSIAGVPFSTNAQGGTSDNVGAVYLRNGYEIADTFVRDTEDCFRVSNRRFDEIMFAILRAQKLDKGLTIGDIDIQFSRSEVENLLVKTQAALNLKQLGFAPAVVLEKTGLSNDPLSDIERSEPYISKAWEINEENGNVFQNTAQGNTDVDAVKDLEKSGNEKDDTENDS